MRPTTLPTEPNRQTTAGLNKQRLIEKLANTDWLAVASRSRRKNFTSAGVIVVEEGRQGDPTSTDSHHHSRVEKPNQTQLALLTELGITHTDRQTNSAAETYRITAR